MSGDFGGVMMAPWMLDPQAPGRIALESRFTAPTDLCPYPERWLSTDCGSAELQVSELVAGIVTGLQPDLVIETGAAFGQTTVEIGRRLLVAQRGRCWTIEIDPVRAECVRSRTEGLPVDVYEGDSLAFPLPDQPIDLLFLDSSYENRIPEFERFRTRMRPGAIALFHDTAPGHGAEDLGGIDLRTAIEQIDNVRVIHLPTPRGLTIVEVLGAPRYRAPMADYRKPEPPPLFPADAGPDVPGSTAVVMPAGHTLRVLDHRVGANRKAFAVWEARYIETLLRVVKPGAQVFDVGAEEGEFGALVAKTVGAENVHLFEPSPRAWPNIRAVWEANGLGAPWTFPGFAAPTTRPESFSLVPRAPGWPAQAEGPLQTEGAFSVWIERPDLPAVSLDYYARATGVVPDVVMIDVEGAETIVLDGMAELLRDVKPVVFVSIHPPSFISRFGPGMEEAHAPQQEHVFRTFSQADYVGGWISQDHEAHWMFVHSSSAELLSSISL